jgi:hypothetical protein
MSVLDALFDHIQQISCNVEITGSLVQFAQFRQSMSELGVILDRIGLSARAIGGAPVVTLSPPSRGTALNRFLIFRNSA